MIVRAQDASRRTFFAVTGLRFLVDQEGYDAHVDFDESYEMVIAHDDAEQVDMVGGNNL